MRFRHKYVINSKEIATQIKRFKMKYGQKPDYLVLNTKTLAVLCGGLSFGQIPHEIEYLSYYIDDDIGGNIVILCEV